MGTMNAFGGPVRLLWYLYVCAFGIILLAIVPEQKSMISDIGRNSLVIYVFHGTLIYLFLYFANVHKLLNALFPGTGHKYILFLSLIIVAVLGTENYIVKALRRLLKLLTKKQQ